MADADHAAEPATVQAALRQATADFRRAGIDTPGDDARRLMAAVLALTAAQLLSRPERPISADEARRLDAAFARRMGREPVARILGEREFYGRSFAISPATLDPRPDSETLIAATLELAREEKWLAAPLRILDIGTGSGCLLLTLLAELPSASGVGTDISQAALDVASANAQRLGLDARCRWVTADLLEGIAGPFDVLVANPPYVRTGEIPTLEPEVRSFDPHAALDGGDDGLQFYRRLAAAMARVVPDGLVVLEVGAGQAEAVTQLLRESPAQATNGHIRYYPDAAGRPRCVSVRARNL
jgi:release factor glutamine methyltransferase